jgi:hypothetical protein
MAPRKRRSVDRNAKSLLVGKPEIDPIGREWHYIASLTTPALSSSFFPHLCMHSEKSAISLSWKVLLFQP